MSKGHRGNKLKRVTPKMIRKAVRDLAERKTKAKSMAMINE